MHDLSTFQMLPTPLKMTIAAIHDTVIADDAVDWQLQGMQNSVIVLTYPNGYLSGPLHSEWLLSLLQP